MRPLPTGEPWGDYAVSTARWTGALLHEVLALARPPPAASTSGSRAPTTARTTSTRCCRRPSRDDLTFVRALPLALAADPAAGILIAYEMNGQPLGPDHGAPFRVVVPHWYAVASVKWLKPHRRPHRAVHRRVPDRPLHVPVAGPAPRAGRPHAGARPDHRPRARAPSSTPAPTPSAARPGRGPGRSPASRSASPAKATGTRAELEPPRGPYQWQDWSFGWDASDVGRHTLRARATDAAGNVQPDVPPWNRLGYGNNAIEVIYVDVG